MQCSVKENSSTPSTLISDNHSLQAIPGYWLKRVYWPFRYILYIYIYWPYIYRNGQWYQVSPNFICHVFMWAIPKGSLSDYVYTFYVCKMCMFCIVFKRNFCKIWFSEEPWGDPVRWLGLQLINKFFFFFFSLLLLLSFLLGIFISFLFFFWNTISFLVFNHG